MISVVIPCYNEREVLPALYERLTVAAATWGEPYEVILVDDGSAEDSFAAEREIHERDARWTVVRLGRNFGHQTAVTAGLWYARGDCAVVMDADLQDPPEELGPFLAKWREGYHVVYAIRRKRKEGVVKRALYAAFYRVLDRVADTPIPLDSGDFCVMDRKVVDLLNAMPERHRFVRGLRSWIGFRQVGIEYERSARVAGEVKYTFRKLVRLALDGIFSFSTIPLRLTTYFGFAVAFVAFVAAVFTFFQRLYIDWFARIGFPYVKGFASTVIIVLFLGGVQLISLGIIGEYLGRIYDEVKGRPLWTVREILGADADGRDDDRVGARGGRPARAARFG